MLTDANLLAFDSGSTRSSVALATGAKLLTVDEAQSRSSTQLPRLIADLMDQAGLTWSDLTGIIVARGPGSFTGLRVGMGFALGLHQSLGVAATAVSTLRLLAEASPLDRPVTAALNAWRESWFIQPFTAPPRAPLADARKVDANELPGLDGVLVTMDAIDERAGATLAEMTPALAALRLAQDGHIDWDPSTLQHPLYLQAPPATIPVSPSGGISGANQPARS